MKKEHVISGIFGAILGGAVGIICAVLISRIKSNCDIVSPVTGAVLVLGIWKGYRILAGHRTGLKGMFVCGGLMLIMPYVDVRLRYAWELASVSGKRLWSAFGMVPELIKWGTAQSGEYWEYLLADYFFTIFWAILVMVPQYVRLKEEREKM